MTRSRTRQPAGPDFRTTVLRVVRRIPPGRVATYGDVARLAGRPQAARAVGRVMAMGGDPGTPFHRVIGAGGALGGFGGAPQMKAALLLAEGVAIRGHRVLNFRVHRWRS